MLLDRRIWRVLGGSHRRDRDLKWLQRVAPSCKIAVCCKKPRLAIRSQGRAETNPACRQGRRGCSRTISATGIRGHQRRLGSNEIEELSHETDVIRIQGTVPIHWRCDL